MAGITLRDYQMDAVKRMKNGCILCGGVGSGKSRTALAYYYILNGGVLNTEKYARMENPKDLYIITTARKRDTYEWEEEMIPFYMSPIEDRTIYENKVVIDSWNNIEKYSDVSDAFFIFDEQRVIGYGVWAKTFIKIAKHNEWILLSATPGDTWTDYIPVFIANGFYKHKTDFVIEHVVYRSFGNFRKVDRYLNTGRLVRLRNSILVTMDYCNKTEPHHEDIYVSYDLDLYRRINKTRWNPWENAPIKNASEYCYALRRAVNVAESRQLAILEILEKHPRVIIFYNFDYELEILKKIGITAYSEEEVAEWNGHKHQPIPNTERWIYLVQYTAGAEGWNCIKTDTIIFYSQNYSYKVMVQSAGRIDRLNTPFTELYYYHLKSRAGIDVAISKALKNKKKFNETKFFSRKE